MFKGELSVLAALYGAKIEATLRLVPRREIAAAMRALRDERRAAFRAIVEKREWAVAAERYAAKLMRRPPVSDGNQPRNT